MDDQIRSLIADRVWLTLDEMDVPTGTMADASKVAIRIMSDMDNILSSKMIKEFGMTDIIEATAKAIKERFHSYSKVEPDMFFSGQNFVPKLLGEYVMAGMFFKTLMGSDEIYMYEDGIYKPNGREYIKSICARLLGSKFKSSYVSEVMDYIKSLTYISPEEINDGWMNLENGLLDPVTREFRKHTPTIFSITRIPIEYNPRADCPLWKQSLRDRVDAHIFDTVQEMFGYCFTPGQKMERAFLLYGPKRTFKSSCLTMLQHLIGKDNLCAYSLQQINEGTFSAGYLYGKTVNICADITSRALTDTGRFLTITGGDPISAGKKNQHEITFTPSTKLIFSCNVIPATTNKNPAFYRRWIILPFERQIPLGEVDPDFRQKLKKELPGILNWAIEGLKRLEENKKFSYQLSEDDVKDMYERNSDTIQSFIYNMMDTEDDTTALTKREVFNAYLKWCAENNLQPENAIKFGRYFIALTGCGTGRKGEGDKSIPAYKGVNWKSIDGKPKKKSIDDYTTKGDDYTTDDDFM